MLNLIQNEWIKIFRQVGTYIMIGLLVLLVIGTGVITKYYESNAETVNDKLEAGINRRKRNVGAKYSRQYCP